MATFLPKREDMNSQFVHIDKGECCIIDTTVATVIVGMGIGGIETRCVLTVFGERIFSY